MSTAYLSMQEQASFVSDFLRKPPKPVLVVGSGTSTDAGLDSWATLESKLRFALKAGRVNCSALDVFQLADRAKKNLGSLYNDILRESFRNPNAEPGELLEVLASLRTHFAFVVTSNYDKLLETAFRTSRLGIDPPITTNLEKAKELYRRGELFVYKFNGDIDDPASIVLAASDYACKRFDEIFAFLSTQRLLFIGYGFRDPMLEHFRIREGGTSRPSTGSDVFLLRASATSSYLLEAGWQVITFDTFSKQKELLQSIAATLVQNPFREIYRSLSVAGPEVSNSPLFAAVRTSVPSIMERFIVLYDNWETGWNPDDFDFLRGEDHELPHDAGVIVERFSNEVEKPWRGKLAFTGLIEPLSERHGKIISKSTSWRKYEVLWKKLDEPGLAGNTTIRERWWQNDIRRRFEASELPHILCMHMAVISNDGQLLLTRKSRHMAFAGKRWCASIEEQVANGRGEADEDSPIDESPRTSCERGLTEELGIPREWIQDLRFYAFGTDWVFSDVSVIGTALLNVPAVAVFAQARPDPTESKSGYGEAFRDSGEFEPDPHHRIQYRWTPARVDNLMKLFASSEYAPDSENGGLWHPTSRPRFFAVMAGMVRWRWATWSEWARALPRQAAEF